MENVSKDEQGFLDNFNLSKMNKDKKVHLMKVYRAAVISSGSDPKMYSMMDMGDDKKFKREIDENGKQSIKLVENMGTPAEASLVDAMNAIWLEQHNASQGEINEALSKELDGVDAIIASMGGKDKDSINKTDVLNNIKQFCSKIASGGRKKRRKSRRRKMNRKKSTRRRKRKRRRKTKRKRRRSKRRRRK